MSGILLINDRYNGNLIFSIDCEPDQVWENIDRVIEFEVYDFVATYDGKTVDGIVVPNWRGRYSEKVEAGLSFGKFATWSIAWAVIVIAAAWFLAWPVEFSGQ